MLNQVCVLTIKLKDLEDGIDFYTKQLDFKVAKRYNDQIIQLEHKGIPVILEKTDPEERSNGSTVVLGIQSNAIQEDYKKLKSRRVTILQEPKPCPPGYFFIIEDPNGNKIEIVEFTK
ncbi:Catechol 2,3-dioxygenase [Oceanobacillus limi]|uniref:Catechol 2,3-dioxygenase n=1 Tax=Oceanobacillus limi TaxID=930131 RepID=A0A1I0AXC7_9BACI|nr:VOC family protein [Oceanobacillus limi]SES99036.1 Catechol 2,3-dioxygenase [Oceanobacillus limi]